MRLENLIIEIEKLGIAVGFYLSQLSETANSSGSKNKYSENGNGMSKSERLSEMANRQKKYI